MIRGDTMGLLKMNLFNTKTYNDSQLALIDLAKEYGQDETILKNVDFSIKQMRCLILATKDGIDVTSFANPKINYYTMLLIVQCAKNNVDYSALLQLQLNQTRASAIYYNLARGLFVQGNENEDELFERFEISTGISKKECQIPIYVEWSQGLSEILIDSRLIYYRNKFINEGLSRKEAENEAKRKIRFEFS